MGGKPATEVEARRAAAGALASGAADDPVARTRGRFLDPLRISHPDGTTAGWMVPIALDDRLLGFVQVDAEGTFARYASFQRRPGAVETCPSIDTWTDPATIRAQALAAATPGSRASEPVLTYDASPDRLAWAVTVTAPDGACTRMLVANGFAWADRRRD